MKKLDCKCTGCSKWEILMEDKVTYIQCCTCGKTFPINIDAVAIFINPNLQWLDAPDEFKKETLKDA